MKPKWDKFSTHFLLPFLNNLIPSTTMYAASASYGIWALFVCVIFLPSHVAEERWVWERKSRYVTEIMKNGNDMVYNYSTCSSDIVVRKSVEPTSFSWNNACGPEKGKKRSFYRSIACFSLGRLLLYDIRNGTNRAAPAKCATFENTLKTSKSYSGAQR